MPVEQESKPTDYELSPLAEVLARRFIQRWDCYPQQTEDGAAYFTTYEPLHVGLLFAHLRGEITLGTYLLNEKSHGRFLILDADDAQQWQQLINLASHLKEQDTSTNLEASRRGGHLWFFFEHWLPGGEIRQFAQGLLAAYEIQGIEIYPKQDHLGKGPGSLVRLPFGVHRKAGRRYGFIDPDGAPLASTIREQLRLLGKPQIVPKTALAEYVAHWAEANAKSRKIDDWQPQSTHSTTEGEGPLSEQIKAAIPIREFIGHYVELSESGQGLCPFHDDHNPSFSVNEAENYWYCFACDIGGSVIDFCMKWQDCEFQAAVQELAEKVLKTNA